MSATPAKLAAAVTKLGPKFGKLGTKLIGVGTVVAAHGQKHGAVIWKYAKVELKPPSFNEFPQIQKNLGNIVASFRSGKFKEMPLKDIWLNFLVCAEIAVIFFVGEIIGKGGVVGYYIPGYAWTHHGEDSRKWADKGYSAGFHV